MREPLSNIELEDKLNSIQSDIQHGVRMEIRCNNDKQNDRWAKLCIGLAFVPSIFLTVLKLYGLITTPLWLIWLPLEIVGGIYALLTLGVLIVLGTSNQRKDNEV